MNLSFRNVFQSLRKDFQDRSTFFFMKLNQAEPEIYNSSAMLPLATTRETRVPRLAGKVKLLLLFGFFHECLFNLALVLFKTFYCLNYDGANK